ncbi:MAG: AMP-dependent synthetase/ligase [Rhodopila sp.]
MRTYPKWPNLAAMMFSMARARASKPFLRYWRSGAWHSISWGEFGRMAASCARRIRAAGVSAGDRVLICMENRPEFTISETALMAIRAIPVPAYTTNTVDDHAYLLRDSGARTAIVSSVPLAAKVLQAAERVGGLDLLVVVDGDPASTTGAARVMRWADLVQDRQPPDDIAQEAAQIPSTALACLIYTSGTGGTPRGAMLPHRCMLANCAGAFEVIRPLNPRDDVYLSYLPMAHAFEHTVGQYFLPSLGCEIVYSRGVENLAADLQVARPTLLTAVPRVLEVIRARILAQVGREKPWRQRLFQQALAIGLKRIDGKRLTLRERLLDPLLERVVRAKVLKRFGGRIKIALSGGARLDPEVGRFFLALGLPIMQGYGQTEAGPVISVNKLGAIRIDTVGEVLAGVELRLAEDGEILVRGDLVMDGYWNRPEETAQVIQDGWLHTGDIGELDHGYLRITDRKKDIIVLSGGENVSPAKIESLLMAESEIGQAVISGDGRSGLSALVVPAEGFDDAAVALAVDRANKRLSATERVRKHAVVGPFTIENGLLTPSQKIRRLLVIRANAHVLAKLH